MAPARRIASAIASATRHQPSYLSRWTASRAEPRSQTALRTRSRPAGQRGAEPALEVAEGRLAAARAHRSPRPARQRERQSSQTSASPWRGGTGASHSRHAGGSSQRSTPAERLSEAAHRRPRA